MKDHDDAIFEDWSTDYTQLSEEVLSKLVLGDDLFVATSALSEIGKRNSLLARDLSLRILHESLGDKYLQASAITNLIPKHLQDLYDYISHINKHMNHYVLNSILSDLCDEVGVINKESDVMLHISAVLCEMIQSHLSDVDKEIAETFLKYYCNPC